MLTLCGSAATVAAQGAEGLLISADAQYRYAQSRLDAGAYDEAVYEFNRFIHFFPQDERIPAARYRVGLAYFEGGRYDNARAVFQTLANDLGTASPGPEAFIMLSRSHARTGLIDQAMLAMHNLIALSPPIDVTDRARYELGWLHVEQGQWDLADRSFNRITPLNRQRWQINTLEAALAESDGIPSKSPTTAGLLSILPGGGQLYCGRYQDALVALLINGGLIWAAWEAFDNELYALGGLISFVEVGFYAGNIYGAVSSAHKYNQDRLVDFRESLKRRRPIPLTVKPVPAGVALCWRIDF